MDYQNIIPPHRQPLRNQNQNTLPCFLMFPVTIGLNSAPSALTISGQPELADLILHP